MEVMADCNTTHPAPSFFPSGWVIADTLPLATHSWQVPATTDELGRPTYLTPEPLCPSTFSDT